MKKKIQIIALCIIGCITQKTVASQLLPYKNPEESDMVRMGKSFEETDTNHQHKALRLRGARHYFQENGYLGKLRLKVGTPPSEPSLEEVFTKTEPLTTHLKKMRYQHN